MRTEITDTQTPERSIVRHISRDIREKFLNFFFFPESLIFGFTLVITGEHLCTIALYFQKGRAISLFAMIRELPSPLMFAFIGEQAGFGASHLSDSSRVSVAKQPNH